MATQGIEEVTENAIRAVARDCGSLSIECSDVAGYVSGVATRISENLKMLDQLEEVTTRLLADQGRVSDSTDEARLLAEQAKVKLDSGREAIDWLRGSVEQGASDSAWLREAYRRHQTLGDVVRSQCELWSEGPDALQQ